MKKGVRLPVVVFVGLTLLAAVWWSSRPSFDADTQTVATAESEVATPAASAVPARIAEARRAAAAAERPALSRVSRSVRKVLTVLQDRGITPANFAASGFHASDPFLRMDENARVQLYVHLAAIGRAQLDALRALDFDIEIENAGLLMVQGWVPFDRVVDIAALPFVQKVALPDYATARQGSALTEGDAIARADLVRALGVNGAGVKVGILSDGANHLAEAQSSNDLPSSVDVFGSCTAAPRIAATCNAARTCDEGTAMAEIVHDVAPGAELAIAAASTSLEFINQLNALVNTFGANIIVDDLGFPTQPFFEDGAVAQAVAAITNNVVYVSAAGNVARHYEGDYLNGNFLLLDTPVNLHDFGVAAGGPTDASANVKIGPNSFMLAVLQWNDKFGSSNNDYDLLLGDVTESFLLCPDCFSTGIQDGNDDPVETLCMHNPNTLPLEGKLAMYRFDGGPVRLEIFVQGENVTLEYERPDGSIFGHPGLPGVLAVGAVNASPPGNNQLEPYSARGPSRIDRPSVQQRAKPDLVATDGVSVTGAGAFPTTFFGTSASAPHVAGIAALLKEAIPQSTPGQVRTALKSGAIDVGAAGVDGLYGAGRADAPGALSALAPDADGDGVADVLDAFPNDPTESVDTDSDGTGNNSDDDDDDDQMPDGYELAFGGNPLDASDATDDADGDGLNNREEFTKGYDAGDRSSPTQAPQSDVLLVSAILPGSRSVQVGVNATTFGTMINAGSAGAIDCRILPITAIDADFFYQTTDPATNALINSRNQSIPIAGGNGLQTFILGLTPRSTFAPTDVAFAFRCTNSNDAGVVSGLNTLLLSASVSPVADLIALAATMTGDGIVHINPAIDAGAFSVATVNVGAADTITVYADTNNVPVPVNVFVCQTNPVTAACLAPPSASVTTAVAASATPTFSVFVSSSEIIALDPATKRVFVRFKDPSGANRGITSVAVQTD